MAQLLGVAYCPDRMHLVAVGVEPDHRHDPSRLGNDNTRLAVHCGETEIGTCPGKARTSAAALERLQAQRKSVDRDRAD